MYTHAYPRQRLSFKEKMKNDKKWAKETYDSILINHLDNGAYPGPSYHATNNGHRSEYHRMLSNYQLFNNHLNQTDFERECNPMGLNVGKFKDEIKAYNKTYNIINVLLGEHLKRPWDYKTVIINNDGIKQALMETDSAIRTYLHESMQQLLSIVDREAQQMFDQAGSSEQQQEEIRAQLDEQIASYVEKLVNPNAIQNYVGETTISRKEKAARKILEYYTIKDNFKDLQNDSFKHGMISGYEFGWVGVVNNEPRLYVRNPLGMMYLKSPEEKFIQNGFAAGFRTRMTSSDVLNELGQTLTDKDIKRIEDYRVGAKGSRYHKIGKEMVYPDYSPAYQHLKHQVANANNEGSYGLNRSLGDEWIVYHLEWVSQRKVYFAKFINKYGDEQIELLGEEFEIPEYAESKTVIKSSGKRQKQWVFDGYIVEEGYIPEVWQGYKIGDDMYTLLQPKEHQFRSIDNPNRVKLGYHGLAYSNMNASNIAPMDRMKPFQYLYFITMHKLKELIARDKGQVYHFDVLTVDPKIGLEKTLYYLDKLDLDIYNSKMHAQAGTMHTASKITQSTSRSNMQFIMNYVNLLAYLDDQISDVAGVTKARQGQSSPYEAVGNNQQSITQSSHITETYFHLNSLHWKEMLNSFVNVASDLWKESGVFKRYVLDDLTTKTLEIQPGELDNAEFGLFINNAPRETEVFRKLEALAEPLIRTDSAKMGDLVRLFTANSVEELKGRFDKHDVEKQLQKEGEQKQAQQLQQQQIQAAQAAEKTKRDHELRIKTMELETDLAIAGMKTAVDLDGDGINDIDLTQEQLAVEREKIASKERIEEKKNRTQEKVARIGAKSKTNSTSK